MSIEGTGSDYSDVVSPQTQESMPTLTAEQVRKVVQREKAEAAEKGRREAEAQYQKQLAELKSGQSMGGMEQSIDTEKMYSEFRDRLMSEAQKEQENQREAERRKMASEISESYHGKMSRGKDLYEDFDAVTADFDATAFPQIVYLANGMENTADIMYELSKNPSKLVTINDLALRSPQMAQSQLQKLAESIKMNQTAKANNVSTSPPLSRAQPSATAGSDTGAMSIRDLKKMKYLRG